MSFLKPSVKLLVQNTRASNFNRAFQASSLCTVTLSQLKQHNLSLQSNLYSSIFSKATIKSFSCLTSLRAPNKDEKPIIANESSNEGTTVKKVSPVNMTWDQYFQHKKMRRLRDKILSLPAAFVACSFTGSYLMTNVVLDASESGLIFGLDPFIVFGLTSAASGLVAFLVTPLLGSLIYRLFKPQTYQAMILKDADFYQRIAKYRVNMSVQPRSVSAPPDFYGEKILSRKDYRHWLRRQFDYKRQMAF
ncbi:TIM23 complex component [Entomophthora muscae]|uniref:TIM23 complex component n=1 Tax=Entomophthora muscae TaxID=34485 RepID=A0ACC2SJ18_9FUNG|nr:TIM23 complex component [Entomophthora muscae]